MDLRGHPPSSRLWDEGLPHGLVQRRREGSQREGGAAHRHGRAQLRAYTDPAASDQLGGSGAHGVRLRRRPRKRPREQRRRDEGADTGSQLGAGPTHQLPCASVRRTDLRPYGSAQELSLG